jgi:hypothetical protein
MLVGLAGAGLELTDASAMAFVISKPSTLASVIRRKPTSRGDLTNRLHSPSSAHRSIAVALILMTFRAPLYRPVEKIPNFGEETDRSCRSAQQVTCSGTGSHQFGGGRT